MLSFKLRCAFPELDKDAYIGALKDSIRQAMIAAARKFLLAAIPLIPVFTGFARSAFANLEDIAGRVQTGRIRGTLGGVKKQQYFQKKKYYYYPPGGGRVERTNIGGRKFSTQPQDIISGGRATIGTAGSRIIFKFSVDIAYFDQLDRSKWHAFEAGQAAFNQEFKVQFDRLKPKIGKYLVRREIK